MKNESTQNKITNFVFTKTISEEITTQKQTFSTYS